MMTSAMNTMPLSDLFDGQGVIITPSMGERLVDLDGDAIISLFELKGVLLFRGFDLEPHHISTVTDRYTERYTPDALRRETRFEQQDVHDVDYGTFPVPLHSEASFAPAWSEIVWFYCNVPPREGGATTLCDGIKLWQLLSDEARATFLAEPLRYELELPVGLTKPGEGTEPWTSNMAGVNGYLDWDTGILHLTLLRYALHESRSAQRLCFINHLLTEEPQIKHVTMASGKIISPAIIDEIREKSRSITYEIKWEPRDLLMIDNYRFMHGRCGYEEGMARDIVNVQTLRASFAFGASTRQSIKRPVRRS